MGIWIFSVSARTTEPELALKLLEKIHTDQRYYDLVAYGVEGSNYNLVDGKISLDGIGSENRFSWTAVTDDVMGYEAVPIDERWDLVYQRILRWSEECAEKAQDDPLDGFAIVPSDKEQAAIDRVWLQYFQPLVCGYREDYLQELDAANERLQEAGFDRYLAALQEQLTEYAAEKRVKEAP